MVYQHWINGAWVPSLGGQSTSISNPATGTVLAQVAAGGARDVDAAVKAATAAWEDRRWSGMTPAERSKVLWKLADLLEARAEEFARLESENTGKPFAAVALAGDIPFAVDNLRFFAGAARDIAGTRAGEYAPGYTSYARREPVGVVGQITPWNFPLMMAAWKIGPALAAGCTLVLKPAPATPLTTLKLAELSKEAGVPDGVLNVVAGDNEAGQALVDHPGIRMVSLTGSTATGKRVMGGAAETLKRVHLELGGKAPLIVLPDADIPLVALKASLGACLNSGQDCTGASRLLIHASIYERVRAAVVKAMGDLPMGDPFGADTLVGSLISDAHRQRVHGFVSRAVAAGASVLTGGTIPPGVGFFYPPTVLEGVDQRSEIVQTEVFGPVMTLQKFTTTDEALALANDVPYGLAASVFTKDVALAVRLTGALEFGTVWVNDHLPLVSEQPHGGFKQSGFGKDMSAEAVGDYLITRHVMISHSEAL